MLKDRTPVHDNTEEKFINSTIKLSQDMYIHPILGTLLFNKLISEVDNGTITGNYKALLDDYIVDALIWWTVAGLTLALPYQFWNKGVIRKVGTDTELPDATELETLRNEYKNRAEWYCERLRQYLIAYSTSSFLPEYFETTTKSNELNPSAQAFTMPIYLGDYHECVHLDKNNCNCHGES